TWALTGVLGVAGFVLLHLWTPSEEVRFSVCLSRRLLGLPCPGCGITRALAHLAKGEWRAALAAHPFAPLLAAELVFVWLVWGFELLGLGGRLPRRIWPEGLSPLVLANVALLTALWMGRLAAGALPR
ncbi:MAG TPA: DUF2752 domain-containing protein, partial [Thermoanaerobaculia bacterium]|nr:DUF2752 domain-containing protein [Thermoanaerobaculia bacterium]